MTIALMSHDGKKEMMVQFCIAYKAILAKHDICATSITGKLVAEATGLPVKRYLAGSQGGDQQIGARIAYDEIDMVLFFTDGYTRAGDADRFVEIFSLCDRNNVPVATNLATAELLILGLARGYLDWREIVKSSRKK